ncbi:MAG: transposase [Bacteroidota bacterium]
MKRKRRTFSPEFKLKVILSALQERETLSELSQKYDLHANQISKWKSEFLDNATHYLKAPNKSNEDKESVNLKELYAKIGQLQMELDFLKKKLL